MTRAIENFIKMGLNENDAQELYDRTKNVFIDDKALDAITNIIVKHGDSRNYHEFLHMSHFVHDTERIIEEIKKDDKAANFFGLDITKDKESGIYLAGLGHDLSLILTKKGISTYMDLETGAKRLGNPDRRCVAEHHRRSKIILSYFFENEELQEILELSSVVLTREELLTLAKQKKVYQTIPMIIDALAFTKENYASGVAETPFVEDIIFSYLAEKITAQEAVKEIKETVLSNVQLCESKLGKELKFNHEEMSDRLAKKKNFPTLYTIRHSFPGVYHAIIESGENSELERALNHKWYAAGVLGGKKAIIDALSDSKVRKEQELCKTLELLGSKIEGVQHYFKGHQN